MHASRAPPPPPLPLPPLQPPRMASKRRTFARFEHHVVLFPAICGLCELR